MNVYQEISVAVHGMGRPAGTELIPHHFSLIKQTHKLPKFVFSTFIVLLSSHMHHGGCRPFLACIASFRNSALVKMAVVKEVHNTWPFEEIQSKVS